MANTANIHKQVLLVTGFAPINLPQLADMGLPSGPISLLSSLAGKTMLQFTIPTVAPAVLAAYLSERGVDVEITDCFIEPERKYDADVVGISSTFMGVENVINIARKAKRDNSNAVVVLGGPLSWSVAPAELLELIPEIDYIILREGELTFYELLKSIEIGSDAGSIAGLAFKRGGSLVQTPQRCPIECETIKRPDWEKMGIPSSRRLPVLPVETSRGCPFNCAYCSEVTYWDKPVRYRPIADVVEEIIWDATELGINTFRFTDSCFSAPPERCGELCDSIYERGIAQGTPVKWSSYARISNLDYGLMEKMKRSGCVALDIGVESGSKEMLRSMGRNYAPEKASNIAKFARELGIITNFNVVLGFPGETRETVMRTAELIDIAAPDTFVSFLFYLAPNTRVNKDSKDFHVAGQGLKWKHDTMTSEEAGGYMLELEKLIKNSTNFPGGEYMACYLTSLGYLVDDIKRFYKGIRVMATNNQDSVALQDVKEVVASVSRYW